MSVRFTALAAVVALVACAPPSRASGVATCEVTNAAAAAVDEIRKSVEGGPLFAALTAQSTVRTCTARGEGSRIVLDYATADGDRLHLERDPSVEFSLQELRFTSARALDARELLTRVERDAFGDDGCGVDWARGDSRPVADAKGMTETTFRGDVCSCQARVRADTANRVVAVSLRSAC